MIFHVYARFLDGSATCAELNGMQELLEFVLKWSTAGIAKIIECSDGTILYEKG